MPPFQILNMLNVCFASDGKACGLEPPHAELHSIERHDFDRLLPDVFDEPQKTKDAMRHLGLELGFSRKDDNGLDDIR